MLEREDVMYVPMCKWYKKPVPEMFHFWYHISDHERSVSELNIYTFVFCLQKRYTFFKAILLCYINLVINIRQIKKRAKSRKSLIYLFSRCLIYFLLLTSSTTQGLRPFKIIAIRALPYISI